MHIGRDYNNHSSFKNKMSHYHNVCWMTLLLMVVVFIHCDIQKVQLLMGRFDTTTSSDFIQYDWTAVQYSISFTNSSSMPFLLLQDKGNGYLISVVDLSYQLIIHQFVLQTVVDSDQTSYDLSKNGTITLNANRKYQIIVQKRTEALFGIVKLYGFHFQSSHTISYIHNNNNNNNNTTTLQRIEFIGDSLSCGYGNEGQPPCPFSSETENGLKSFPVLTAQSLQTQQYSVSCWSGKGVVRNYADKNPTSSDPMPLFYPRTLANNSTLKWNFNSFQPDLIVITLGTNDFSTAPRPSWEDYSTGYNQLIDAIQTYYSYKPDILCFAMGNIANYGNYTARVVKERGDKKVHFHSVSDSLFNPNTDTGCSGHPNLLGDMKIANSLIGAIRGLFNNSPRR